MQLTQWVVGVAVTILLPNFIRAGEPEALEQLACWRSAVAQPRRVALKFRAVHIDQFTNSPPITCHTILGVCYRDGEDWAMTIVPAPVSALEPRNCHQDLHGSLIARNPEFGFEPFMVIDGPAELHYRWDDDSRSFGQPMRWRPASAVTPENTPAGLWTGKWSMASLFAPVNFLPLFWPAEIDISQFDIKKSVNDATGVVSLTLQRKPMRNWGEYRPRHLDFDRLIALFRIGTDVPYAIAFSQSPGAFQIRYYFHEYETDENADIPCYVFNSFTVTKSLLNSVSNP